MDIVIIGNSAAGTAAIEAIRKSDSKSRIIQLTDESHPLYSRCLLSHYIAGTLGKQGLYYRDKGFHEQMNIDLFIESRVKAVDPEKQKVECDDGRSFDFDKLLIATGASSKLPPNMTGGIDGIFTLRTLDDANIIKKKMQNMKNAVVLGGGLIGMRAAYALSKTGLNVKVIMKSDHILSQMIDFRAALVVTQRLAENNIEVLANTDVSEVLPKQHQLKAVKTDRGRELDCELLIVAKGVNANTDLIEGTDIDKRWGIVTNSNMQTNYQNIFAAGDVAETMDITTGEYSVNALWTCAVQQGNIAGLNIAGKEAEYDGSLGMNSMNIFNVPVISFGITSPKDESEYTILVDDRVEQGNYRKVTIKDDRIVGIIIIGKVENAGVLLALIQKKADVSRYQDELLSENFNYGNIIKHEGIKALERY